MNKTLLIYSLITDAHCTVSFNLVQNLFVILIKTEINMINSKVSIVSLFLSRQLSNNY